MPGTVHLLVGAALAVLIPHTPTMVVTAFFSHYVLDLIPHLDAETFASKTGPYTWNQKMSLAIDTVLVLTLLVALFLLRNEGAYILLGAVAAQMPDLMIPLERYNAFYPLYRFHTMFHWNEKRAKYWDWYLVSLFAPLAVGVLAFIVIWKY
ncbi:MAG: hypothetical protein WEC84_03885 [Candidatus Andersenbacteria bacterium]